MNKNWKFSVICRPPSRSIVNFLDNLCVIVDQNINLYDRNILVGDFNIDKLKEIVSNAAMTQCVMFDTRITEHSSTRIDLVYSNDKSINCDKLDEFQKSDH